MEDRIERLLLEPDALVALMPDTLGPLEKRGGGGGTDLHRKPMRSRATSLYGMASLSLTDYGDPEIARQALTPARELQGFAMYTTGREDAVGSAPLAIEGGEGDWVWMKQEAPSPSAIGISIARGRFVIEYAGPFVPKPEPLDPSAPEEFRKQIEEIQKNQGAGAFESIEAQRDAVLQSIEAMDLDAFDN
ncbi:MAG TPA: hypothetical protein ENJ09_06105 [Planctomycetes bacterium]|nr:hypothetical protein [Planctomycetota bacterium]